MVQIADTRLTANLMPPHIGVVDPSVSAAEKGLLVPCLQGFVSAEIRGLCCIWDSNLPIQVDLRRPDPGSQLLASAPSAGRLCSWPGDLMESICSPVWQHMSAW